MTKSMFFNAPMSVWPLEAQGYFLLCLAIYIGGLFFLVFSEKEWYFPLWLISPFIGSGFYLIFF